MNAQQATTLTATGRSSLESSHSCSRSRSATKSAAVIQANSALLAMSPMSQQSRKSGILNASQTERSLQLKVANERLAQLENMYEELSVLEQRAANRR